MNSQPSLTERLAGYWSGARYEDLPQPVVAMAKSVLLDTLAVGVRGAERSCRGDAQRNHQRAGVQQRLCVAMGHAIVAATQCRRPRQRNGGACVRVR